MVLTVPLVPFQLVLPDEARLHRRAMCCASHQFGKSSWNGTGNKRPGASAMLVPVSCFASADGVEREETAD